MQQLRRILFLSSPNRSAKWWLMALIIILIGQIALMLSIGNKGRDAVKNRIDKTEANFIEDGIIFESEAEKQRQSLRSVRLREFVPTGLWYGAAIGTVFVLSLILSIRWWSRSVQQGSENISFPSRRIVIWLLGIANCGAGGAPSSHGARLIQ